MALDHTSWVFFSLTHIRENTKHTHIRYITFPIEYVHIKQYLQCTQEKLGISYLNFYVQKILWWFTDVIPIRYFLFYHFSVNRVFANVYIIPNNISPNIQILNYFFFYKKSWNVLSLCYYLLCHNYYVLFYLLCNDIINNQVLSIRHTSKEW